MEEEEEEEEEGGADLINRWIVRAYVWRPGQILN